VASLDVARLGSVEFTPPDSSRFPCLRLAYAALERGGAWPVVLNAANEMAVEAFLAHAVPFHAIPVVIERALEAADRHVAEPQSLSDVRAADAWAREFSAETIGTLPSS
jgi:1-deoxy-D-xylulose-5-phosphate reductoisomerase